MSKTFLGSPGVGNVRGEERFPVVARKALGNAQTRHNISHATHTIQARRNEVVSECSDWEVLRLAGSALKQNVMARLPELQLDDVAAVVTGCSVVRRPRTLDVLIVECSGGAGYTECTANTGSA